MPKKAGGEKEKKEAPTTLKGMRDLIGDEYHKYQGFSEKAAEVALYYGFSPIDTPILEREDVFLSTNSEDTDMVGKEMYTLKTKGGDKLSLRPEFTAPAMRAYIEHGMQALPQPVKLYYYGSLFRHDNPQRGRYREFKQFGLEMLGTNKSIADAMIIYMVWNILQEVGLKNIVVEVNSIGDKESRTPYTRELTSYYRKHISQICADCRQRMKTNPLRLLDCKKPECQAVREKAPQSVAFLSPVAKTHFKEVLEYLDALHINYRINPHLVRGLDYYTHTVFEIMEESVETTQENGEKKEEPLSLTIAGGGRYDYLAKRLGSKKDVPAVGASIGVDRVLLSPSYKAVQPRVVKNPKIYFIQIGFEAKLKSLEIIEILRNARIPVLHSLNKDSLSAQLATAEKMDIPYAIIFGQKEALEGTVIVRNMETRSQDTVKIDKLTDYLKKMK